MQGNSRIVTSAQTGVHEQLAVRVARHARTAFQKPVMAYNRAAFEHSMAAWDAAGRPPLILDAGCGVGLSTLNLARAHPDHFVVGVDQSADRLARKTIWEGALPDNQVRVRADLVDYWRLLHEAGVRLDLHFLLYPNPWPKIGHLGRRWHGHPVFPVVVGLGGVLECRSNWRIYVDECAAALTQLTAFEVRTEPWNGMPAITPFEQKYRLSGHALWRCRVDLKDVSHSL